MATLVSEAARNAVHSANARLARAKAIPLQHGMKGIEPLSAAPSIQRTRWGRNNGAKIAAWLQASHERQADAMRRHFTRQRRVAALIAGRERALSEAIANLIQDSEAA